MKKITDFILKYPKQVIIFIIIITLFFTYFITRLSVNSDIISYLSQNDTTVKLFNEVGEKFGGNSLAMIAFESEDVFNYKTLTRLKVITEELENLEGVSDVISLINILDFKKIEGGLEVGKLIEAENIPEGKEDLQKLKKYTMGKEMYVGSLVSHDSKFAVIVCRVEEGVNRAEVGRKIIDTVEGVHGEEKAYFAGIPTWMVYINDIVVNDVKKTFPMVVLLVILTLFFSFRNFRGVILPLATVLISTIWSLGLMGLLNIHLTMASNAIPVLLIAIGSAYGIHMMSKYHEDINFSDNKNECIRKSLNEVGVAIILAGLTTMIGFFAFSGSSLSLIREFGIFTGLGVLFSLIISITFIPAVLSLLKRKTYVKASDLADKVSVHKFMDKWGGFVLKNEKPIIVIFIIIMILSILGLPRLTHEVNMEEYFPKKSKLRVATDVIQKNFGGAIPIQLFVKGDLKDPAVLKKMIEIEKYIETLPDVNDPQSAADLICEVNDVMNDNYCIPETRRQVANLWIFLEGQEILNQLINSECDEGVIQAKIGVTDTGKIINIVDKINKFLSEEINGELITVNLKNVEKDKAEYLKQKRIDTVLQKINWDLQIEKAEGVELEKIKTILLKSTVTKKSVQPDAGLIKKILLKVDKYFQDEEDISYKYIKNLNNIKNSIKHSIINGKINQKIIKNILNKNIKASLWAEDPELLEISSSTIYSMIKSSQDEKQTSIIFNNIITLLPDRFKNNPNLIKKLKGNLWSLNNAHVIIKLKDYKKLFGDKQINTKKLFIQQTGMGPVYKELDQQLINSQIQSLIIAFILVFILLTFQLKSFTGGLISMSPLVFTILFNFGLMSYMGIPLDDATMMISCVAIGIGIDYTIHFISRFKKEFAKEKTVLKALDKTLETTGVAIIINAFSVMMGFLVLLAGSLIPLRNFGWLTAVTMAVSAVSSITFLPAILLLTKAKFIGEFDRILDSKKIGKLMGKAKSKMKEMKNRFNK